MGKLISIQAARDLRQANLQDPEYEQKIRLMDKLALLEEMVRFQEERSRLGTLTTEMMVQGKILFRALERNAETQELKLLTSTYRKHLEHELAEYLRTGKLNSD